MGIYPEKPWECGTWSHKQLQYRWGCFMALPHQITIDGNVVMISTVFLPWTRWSLEKTSPTFGHGTPGSIWIDRAGLGSGASAVFLDLLLAPQVAPTRSKHHPTSLQPPVLHWQQRYAAQQSFHHSFQPQLLSFGNSALHPRNVTWSQKVGIPNSEIPLSYTLFWSQSKHLLILLGSVCHVNSTFLFLHQSLFS